MKENCLCNIVLAVIAMKERWNIKKIKQRWRERERERESLKRYFGCSSG